MDRKNEKNVSKGDKRWRSSRAVILLTILSLVLVVLGASAWFYAIYSSVPGEAQQAISIETANILLQFVLIIVIGGLVTFAIGRFDKWRRGDKALQDYRREFIKNLTNAYHRVKRIRRELRAAGLSTKYIQTTPSITPKRLEVLQEKRCC